MSPSLRWKEGSVFLLLLFVGCNALSETVLSQLKDLYSNTAGPEWKKNSNWLSDENVCKWYGILCDEKQNSVLELILRRNGLKGTLPSSLSDLFNQAQRIDLSGNPGLVGVPIPTDKLLDSPTNALLYYDGSFCGFTGGLPNSITFVMPKIQHLDLSGNSFSGQIAPSELLTLNSLQKLSLSNNGLQIPFQITFKTFSNLVHLDLSSNRLVSSGVSLLNEVPSPSIKFISYENCGLQGPFPSSYGSTSTLEYLNLQRNSLNGNVLDAWTEGAENFKSLKYLFLSNSGLSGTSPDALFKLQNLKRLHLSRNLLSGPLSPNIWSSPSLEVIDLGSNSLQGTIPDFSEQSVITKIVLAGNNLNGTIPTTISRALNLEYLSLSSNFLLSGFVPSEIGLLSNLDTLFLQHTSLSGAVPTEIGSLSSLNFLYIYGNSISDFSATFSLIANVLSGTSAPEYPFAAEYM